MRIKYSRQGLLTVLVVSAVTVFGFLAAAEFYFRLTIPFVDTNWPGRRDARFGDNFRPGEVLQWTNGIDFWTRTRVNSLGFLDREPPTEKANERCRVLFIGDSFVEAAQVPIESKFHVLLEHSFNQEHPTHPMETLAFGYSGTGQANQLAWYDFFGAPLQPDVVVLVAAQNDFADNSRILEGVRYGWHPLHLPRLFLAVPSEGGRAIKLPIAADAMEHPLTDDPDSTRALHRILRGRSYFYSWLFTHLQSRIPRLAALISGNSYSDALSARMRAIEGIEGFGNVFDGWNYPDDLDMDRMFFTQGPLPRVFEEALALTGYALDEFVERGKRDDFELVVLAGHGLSPHFEPGTVEMGRTLWDRGGFKRLSKLVSGRGIPLVDQNAFLLAQGGTKRAARFSRDAHWSEQGHVWAAGAMLEYFRLHPEACSEPAG